MTKIDEMETRLDNVEKKSKPQKLVIKENIPTKSFIGFITSLVVFIILNNTPDLVLFKYILIGWIMLYAVCTIFELNKASVTYITREVKSVMKDNRMGNADKESVLMKVIHDGLELAADISQKINEEKKP